VKIKKSNVANMRIPILFLVAAAGLLVAVNSTDPCSKEDWKKPSFCG
jgi:hypothetical protein